MKPHFAINLAIIIKLTKKNQIFNLHEHFFAEIEFSALNLTYGDFINNQKTEHIYAIRNFFFIKITEKSAFYIQNGSKTVQNH